MVNNVLGRFAYSKTDAITRTQLLMQGPAALHALTQSLCLSVSSGDEVKRVRALHHMQEMHSTSRKDGCFIINE